MNLGHKYLTSAFLLLAIAFLTFPSSGLGEKIEPILCADDSFDSLTRNGLLSWINSLERQATVVPIKVMEPPWGAIFPPDMASPIFYWEDKVENHAWLISINSSGRTLLKALVGTSWWIPDPEVWTRLISLVRSSANSELDLVIAGIGGWSGRQITAEGRVIFKISEDKIDAHLMFMRKPLPFFRAKKHPEKTSLLLGRMDSYQKPLEILSSPPICANCHSYSIDGAFMAMDADYGGDKGAFLWTRLKEEIAIDEKTILSWNSLPARAPATYSMGLFARVSPCGRYVAGTVNETSVFVMMDDLMFSQLFYPATGQIAIFDTHTKEPFLLSGASRTDMVQTSPAWSPDGKTLAFAATPTNPELIKKVLAKEVLNESSKQTIHVLNKKYPVQFDIYTVPFSNGKGGRAAPLEGASHNGFSNYFPRYSPDGKWIVFTQSPTGLVLQPNSRLVIVPSSGGTPRVLAANREVMNSWHSWSPNSRWLVFTCKANSPYTELYLTHIDEKGYSSPAVRLFRFSSNKYAAMVPEFIPKDSLVPRRIFFPSPETAKGKSMAIDGR